LLHISVLIFHQISKISNMTLISVRTGVIVALGVKVVASVLAFVAHVAVRVDVEAVVDVSVTCAETLQIDDIFQWLSWLLFEVNVTCDLVRESGAGGFQRAATIDWFIWRAALESS